MSNRVASRHGFSRRHSTTNPPNKGVQKPRGLKDPRVIMTIKVRLQAMAPAPQTHPRTIAPDVAFKDTNRKTVEEQVNRVRT